MTSPWNTYKLDTPMAMALAMVMAMMSSERKPPSMPKSQDNTYAMIRDFTDITLPYSDNYLQLV